MSSAEKIFLHVSLLGGVFLYVDGKERLEIRNSKALCLLLFLLYQDNHAATRERLAGLLWSEKSEQNARGSLRQVLKLLRNCFSTIGFEGFVADRQLVYLDRELVKTDYGEAISSLRNGNIPELFLRTTDVVEQFAYGFDVHDASFSAWLQITKQGLYEELVGRLQHVLRSESTSDLDRDNAAECLLKLDRSNEEATRQLILSYAQKGNPTRSTQLYDELWHLLDIQFDAKPEDETQDLISQVKLGALSPSHSSPAKHAPVELIKNDRTNSFSYPILAIKEFRAGTPNQAIEEHELVIGFRQDLISSLVRFRDWVVVDAQNYSDLANNELNRNAASRVFEIDGTYFIDSDSLFVAITIKDADTGQYVWSERTQITHNRWFDALRRFVSRVASYLSVHMSTQSVHQQISEPDISQDAYRAWLHAYRLIWSWEVPARNKAEMIFSSIIDEFPNFSLAFSGLASIYNTEQMLLPGTKTNTDKLAAARRLAKEAVSIDALDARNQVALAWSNGMNGHFDQAANCHRQAYELNPNNFTTAISSASGIAMCGEYEFATQLTDEAIERSPLIQPAHWSYIASTRFICGDYSAAAQAAMRAGSSIPVAQGWLVAALKNSGDLTRARSASVEFFKFIQTRWVGNASPNQADIVDWFVNYPPIKDKKVINQLKKGFELID